MADHLIGHTRPWRALGSRPGVPAWWVGAPLRLPGLRDGAGGLYGLMVMVSVALTMLSCESCSCMGKLKVPA
jgi:hypothetical protein